MAANTSNVSQGADSLLHGEFHARRRALAAPTLTPVRVVDASELTTSVVTSPNSRRLHIITDAAVASDVDPGNDGPMASAADDVRFDPDPWLAEVARIATADPLPTPTAVVARREHRHDPVNLSSTTLGSTIANVARQGPRSDSPFALAPDSYGRRATTHVRRAPRVPAAPSHSVSAVQTPVGMSPIAKPPPNRPAPTSESESPFDSDAGSPQTSLVVAEGGDTFVFETREGSTGQIANFVPRTADSPRRRPPPPPPPLQRATNEMAHVDASPFALNPALRIPFENVWAASRRRLLSVCGAALSNFLEVSFATTRKVETSDEERAERRAVELREAQVRASLRVTLDAILLAWDRLGRPRSAPPNFVPADIRDAFSAGGTHVASPAAHQGVPAATSFSDSAWEDGLRGDHKEKAAALAKLEVAPAAAKAATSASSLATGAEGPVRLLRRRPPAKRGAGKAMALAPTSITQLAVTSSSARASRRAPASQVVGAAHSTGSETVLDEGSSVRGDAEGSLGRTNDATLQSREVSPSRLRGTAIGGVSSSPTARVDPEEGNLPSAPVTEAAEVPTQTQPEPVAMMDEHSDPASDHFAANERGAATADVTDAAQAGAVSDSSSTLTLTTESSADASDDDDDMSETLPGA